MVVALLSALRVATMMMMRTRVDNCDLCRRSGPQPARSQSQFEPLTGIWAEGVVLLHP